MGLVFVVRLSAISTKRRWVLTKMIMKKRGEKERVSECCEESVRRY